MVSNSLLAPVERERLTTRIRPEFKEETMRRSLILVLIAVGGGASYAAGVTEVATGPAMDDQSTWRWQVSSILADQSDIGSHAVAAVGALDADAFDQRYERYSPLGLPESRGNSR
jgi:hypothetical protein